MRHSPGVQGHSYRLECPRQALGLTQRGMREVQSAATCRGLLYFAAGAHVAAVAEGCKKRGATVDMGVRC